MSNIDLVPCPFCGSSNVSFSSKCVCCGHGEYVIDYFILCNNCKARGPLVDDRRFARDDCNILPYTLWNLCFKGE